MQFQVLLPATLVHIFMCSAHIFLHKLMELIGGK